MTAQNDLIGAASALHEEYSLGLLNDEQYQEAFRQLHAQTGQHTAENMATLRRTTFRSWILMIGIVLVLLLIGAIVGLAIVAFVF